ncbi:MAG: hypothetical protein GX879_11335 [Bacteroidales bacterium]|nr:hypothetical protein [Bacteroidales bacterium]
MMENKSAKEVYFGISSFSSKLSESTKRELALLVFLSPEIGAIEAKCMSLAYHSEADADRIIHKMRYSIDKNSRRDIILKLMYKLENWGQINGFITVQEMRLACSMLKIPTHRMFAIIWKSFLSLEYSEEKYIKFLIIYQEILSTNQLNILLDKYLDNKQNSTLTRSF